MIALDVNFPLLTLVTNILGAVLMGFISGCGVGSAMGATVYSDNLPFSVVGTKPTSHFMKLVFSYDEEAEQEYEEKYGKYL